MANADLTPTHSARKPHGILARLRADKRGNAMAIMAMSMIPLTAMIGSGVDMSRAYLTQSRLQQACDAAALAIRRNMTGNTLAAADISEGRKFFDFNFPAATYETTGLTFNVSQVTGSNAISISTTATLPNKVMTLFGFNTQQINVSCDASQDFVSTDIMFVLDVTGSMADTPSGDSTPKITSLRNAVLSFYDELKPAQDALAAKGLRLRYGFVPYSSTVNVGKLLMAQNCEALRDPGQITGSPSCVGPASQSSFYRTYRSSNSAYYVQTPHTYSWLTSSSYTGCIEERKTVNVGTSGSLDIPSGAWDLDINMMPVKTDPNTQWTPWDPAPGLSTNGGVYNSSYAPYGSPTGGYTACPAEARRLQAWDRTSMESYVNTLQPVGGTYHDVGMIWGARMVSSGGVFADSPTSYGGLPVNRYIVFMTDGQLAPNSTIYGLYGVEAYDRRVGGGTALNSTDLSATHQRRFDMMCNRVKSQNVSIWMVVFDSSLSTSMKNCASSQDQASTSANQADLIAKFKQIAKSIGALRVTK